MNSSNQVITSYLSNDKQQMVGLILDFAFESINSTIKL